MIARQGGISQLRWIQGRDSERRPPSPILSVQKGDHLRLGRIQQDTSTERLGIVGSVRDPCPTADEPVPDLKQVAQSSSYEVRPGREKRTLLSWAVSAEWGPPDRFGSKILSRGRGRNSTAPLRKGLRNRPNRTQYPAENS